MSKELWRDVVGFEGVYEVSSLGRVRSVERILLYRQKGSDSIRRRKYPSVIRKFTSDKDGYSRVCLSFHQVHRVVGVHRLVAEAFIPNPYNKPSVNHLNGVRTDNKLSNLEWCTPAENTAHLIKYGKGLLKGEAHANSIFTENDIKRIREMSVNGMNYSEIARCYNCHFSTIRSIILRETWK